MFSGAGQSILQKPLAGVLSRAGDQAFLLGQWGGCGVLAPQSTPLVARLSVVVQRGSPACATYAVLAGDTSPYRSAIRPGPGVSALCEWGQCSSAGT